jgi:hypothetical protein
VLQAATLPAPVFDVVLPRGLDFTLQNSPTSKKYLIETMPCGVALLDYNNSTVQLCRLSMMTACSTFFGECRTYNRSDADAREF